MARKKVGKIYIDAQLGLAQFDKDLRKLEGKLDTVSKQFTKKFQTLTLPTTLNQSAELAVKGLNLVRGAFSQLESVVGNAEDFSDLSDAFEKLYGQSEKLGKDGLLTLKRSLEEVSKIDVAKNANLAAFAGVTVDQFQQIADSAKALGDSVGINATEALNDLTRAVALGQEKLAKNYGLIVDSTKANYEYAKSVGKAVKDLSEQEKKEAERAALLKQMAERSRSLASDTDSVATAINVFHVKVKDSLLDLGTAVNQSDNLAKAIRSIGDAVSDSVKEIPNFFEHIRRVVDLGQYSFANVTQRILQPVVSGSVTEFLRDYGLTAPLDKLYETTVKIQNDLVNKNTKFLAENTAAALTNSKAKNSGSTTTNNGIAGENDLLRDTSSQLDSLKDKWTDTLREISENKLQDVLKDAIKIQDRSGFDAALEQLAKSTVTAHTKEVADALKNHIITQEQADQYFATLRDNTTKPFIEDFEKQGEELIQRLGEKERAEHEKGIEFWRSTFQNAITGVSFDLKDSLQQVAVGAAAEVANSLFGNLGGISSPQDLGGAIAQQILGALGGGSGGGLGSLLGLGGSGIGGLSGIGPVASGDAYGLSLSTGLSSGASTALTSLANFASIAAIAHGGMELANNLLDNERDWKGGAQSGAIAGAGIGTLVLPGLGTLAGAAGGGALGAALGGLIGSDVSRNPDTRARHSFANWLEEQIHNLERFSFVSQNGQLQTIAGRDFNLLEGPTSRFNAGEITSQLANYGDKAFATFTGLGQALKETLGIAEDVGGQIGLILADQFSGNIDNARLLVQQLGLSYEDLAGKLEASALRGEQRWAEFNVQIAGLKDAFEPGLEAVGAFRQAYDNFTRSGGRGIEPVKALRDLMIEAKEAGITSLGALQNQLLATGANAETVNAIFQGLTNSGITTLDQLQGLSDVQIGALVGNIESLSASLTEEWTSVGAQIDDINSKLASLPAELPVRIKIEAIGDLDALDTLNTLNGGSSVDFSEPGADSIKALSGSSGKVRVKSGSVGKGMVINVDARGASPGTEAAIVNALKSMEERVVRRSVNAVASEIGRGRL